MDGWDLTTLEGVSYHGIRETRHTDWAQEVSEHQYGPGQVWEKTFPAGAVELRGNNGGDGSYVMFVSTPANAPTPPGQTGTTSDGCLTSNFEDGENPTTAHNDPSATAAIRCCAMDGVYVGQDQTCINSVTFSEAQDICAEA